MGVVPNSSAGWEKGVEAHSPDSKLRGNPFADYQPDHEAAGVPPASAAFDPEAARYASFQVQQEPSPLACGCGLQFVLCGPLPPLARLTSPPRWLASEIHRVQSARKVWHVQLLWSRLL